MSNTTDERVVGLKFDNAQFERETKTSMGTIAKLKSSLNFNGASRGLENVSNAARNVNMSPLGNAVEAVQVKFSALQVVAMTALANITNSLVNTGRQMLTSLTTTPIRAGFKEYEDGLTAFQTILANTQGGQRTVAVKSANVIKQTATKALGSSKKVNSDSLHDLQKTQVLKLREFEKTADEAVNVAKDQYDRESNELRKSIENEQDAFEDAHDKRLDAYESEYMAQLKSIDNKKYKKIKEIDDEISAIKGQTKTEQEAINRKTEQEKIAALKIAIAVAATDADKARAIKALSDYQAQLDRAKLLRQRDAQIEELNTDKQNVTDKYNKIEARIKDEYQIRKNSENEQYKISKKNMDNEEKTKTDSLNKTHTLALKQLSDQNAAAKQALQDQQDDAMDKLRKQNELAMSNIHAQSAAVKAGSTAGGGVKTINVKASSVKEINDALAELNKYANDTIYSFGDMTKAIGLFTAQGVGLKDSITGIKGIFNLVSMTGGDANKANSAIYQLSQAIASGTVRAQDWISVVNAGIGGTSFQNQLMQTARIHGVSVDQMIAKEGSFRASLQEGWLSSDILLETLSQYTGDISEEQLKSMGYTAQQIKQIQELGKRANDSATKLKTFSQLMETLRSNAATGWATTFKTLFGDLDEATVLWTAVGNTIGGAMNASADARNKMLSDWKALGGRKVLIEGLTDAFKAFTSVLKPIHDAFREVFPPMTGKQLMGITEGFRNLTKRLILTDKQSKNLHDTFKGLFDILDLIKRIIGGALSIAFKILGKVVGSANFDVLDLTGSVGRLLSKFHDWIVNNDILNKGINHLISGIKTVIGFIKKWFDAFIQIPIVQDKIKSFGKVFSSVSDIIKGHTSEGSKQIIDFGNRVKGLNLLSLDGIKMAFKDFKENIVGYFFDMNGKFGDFTKSLGVFKDEAKTNLEQTGTNFDNLKKTIGSFADYIKSKLSNIGLGQILTVVVGGSLILIMKNIVGIAQKIVSPLSALSGVLYGVKDVLKAYSMQIKANALLKVAQAIAVLAASVALLAVLDQQKVWSAVGALGVLAAGLIGISAAMAAINKIGGSVKGATSIMALTVALLIVVTALKKMQGLDPQRTSGSLLVLTEITVGLVMLSIILSKASPDLATGAKLFTTMAIAVVILVEALRLIDKLDMKRVPQDMAVLLTLMTGLTLVARACDNVQLTSAGSILAIAVALRIVVGALVKITKIEPEKALYALGVLTVLFTMLGVVMGIASAAGPNATSGGLAMLAISGALLIMVMVIKGLAKIKPNDMAKAMTAIGGILILFALLIKASNYAGEHAAKAGVMLLLMAGTLLILAVVVAMLSALDPAGLARGTLAIMALIVCFATLIKATSMVKECKSTLILMSVTIGILAISLGTLAMIDPKQLSTATIALSTVMGMFVLLVASTSIAKGANSTLIIMTVVVATLAIILYKLSELPADATLKIAESLSILLLSLSASCLILSAVGSTGPMALIGVAVLAGVVVAVAGLLIGIGALVEHVPKLSEWLDKGMPILEKVGYSLGDFFGNIVKGFAQNILDLLPALGNAMSDFMNAVQPFFDGAKKIDAASMAGVKALAETILILTGASLLEGIASFFGGKKVSLTGFADELVSFGPKLVAYSKSIKGLDSKLVQNSANAAKTLTQMAENLPRKGGIISDWIGSSSLSDFADELTVFGPKLLAYSKSVTGLDPTVVTNSANAAKALSEMANGLPASGGVIADWMGDNTLTDFAYQLVSFGPALMEYATSVTGLDPTVVTNSANAAKSLGEMATNLPNSGGVIADWMGDNTLTSFANQLVSFGPALMSYAMSVSGLDPDVVTNSAHAASSLSALASNLPSTGGFGSWFSGSNDMATFGDQLSLFGISLSKYYKSVRDIDCGTLDEVIVEFKKLVDMAKGISNINVSGMTGFSDGLATLGNFGVTKFIDAFKNASSRVTGAAMNMINSFISGANSMRSNISSSFSSLVGTGMSSIISKLNDFKNSGVNVIRAFINGINSQILNVKASIGATIAGCLVVLSANGSGFLSAGSFDMGSFIEGLNSKNTDVQAVFTTAITNSIETIRTYNKDFHDAGVYVVQGFIDGLNEKIKDAEKAAKKLGELSAKATKKSIDSNSPSKVFHKIGGYAGQGFVNALYEYGVKASNAGANMGKMATKGLTNAISKVSSMVTDDIDSSPTIRPILDLSNINSGVSQINSMFSTNQAIAVSSELANRTASVLQNGKTGGTTVGRSIMFNQNIYSPDPVSRLEIYRQTKNQLSAAKGLVND